MELLAIPLGCQNTAAKWLVMRRRAVFEMTATDPQKTFINSADLVAGF